MLASAPSAPAATPEEILGARPLAPTDRTLFSQRVYPETPEDVPADGDPIDADAAKARLAEYLQVEFPGDVVAQNAAMDVFDDDTAEQKIPSPQLRAAFAAMEGTAADPAVDYFLNATLPSGEDVFLQAGYAGLQSGTIAVVAATQTADQSQVFFARRYDAENPFLLTSVWMHESLHAEGGSAAGIFEEGAANALDDLVWLRQLPRHPELATTGTELARLRNFDALARLNSGTGSRLGLLASNGGAAVLPGSPTWPQTSWWDVLKARYPQTSGGDGPAGPLLASLLPNFHTAGAPACASDRFDQALLDCLDAQGNSGLTPEELAAVATTLKLALPGGTPPPGGSGPSGGGAPPGGPAVPVAPSAAELAAALRLDARQVGRALGRLRTRALLRRRGFKATGLTALGPGRFVLELTTAAPRGPRSRASAKRIAIARGVRSVQGAGSYAVAVRLTPAGKRLLRRARRVKTNLALAFTPRTGVTVRRSAKVTLRR